MPTSGLKTPRSYCAQKTADNRGTVRIAGGVRFAVMEKIMTTDIPEDVLAAMKGIVDWAHSYDHDKLLVNDIPTIQTWLVEVGLLPPLKQPALEDE
jgi:hypothetical protein